MFHANESICLLSAPAIFLADYGRAILFLIRQVKVMPLLLLRIMPTTVSNGGLILVASIAFLVIFCWPGFAGEGDTWFDEYGCVKYAS